MPGRPPSRCVLLGTAPWSLSDASGESERSRRQKAAAVSSQGFVWDRAFTHRVRASPGPPWALPQPSTAPPGAPCCPALPGCIFKDGMSPWRLGLEGSQGGASLLMRREGETETERAGETVGQGEGSPSGGGGAGSQPPCQAHLCHLLGTPLSWLFLCPHSR